MATITLTTASPSAPFHNATASVEACLVAPAGQVVHRERFALNRRTLELLATKILRPGDQVALEAITNCWAVADALRPHVARVVVSNPMANKAIGQPVLSRADHHIGRCNRTAANGRTSDVQEYVPFNDLACRKRCMRVIVNEGQVIQ